MDAQELHGIFQFDTGLFAHAARKTAAPEAFAPVDALKGSFAFAPHVSAAIRTKFGRANAMREIEYVYMTRDWPRALALCNAYAARYRTERAFNPNDIHEISARCCLKLDTVQEALAHVDKMKVVTLSK